MKKNALLASIIFVVCSCFISAKASNPVIEFQANLRATQLLGADFNALNDYSELPNPLDIFLYDDHLVIKRPNGDVWAEWTVNNVEHKEDIGNSGMHQQDVYVSEVIEDGYTLYYVIEVLIDRQSIDEPIYTLKLPMMGDDGVIQSYMHLQQF